MITERRYKIHTDGGARGNPGPAAVGVVIDGLAGGKKEYAEYLGDNLTNNEAEYQAVILGLKKLKHQLGSQVTQKISVDVYMDSELVVHQLNGKYKVKDQTMKNLFMDLWNLRLDFGSVSFRHVPREENSDADRLVNQALDKESSRRGSVLPFDMK